MICYPIQRRILGHHVPGLWLSVADWHMNPGQEYHAMDGEHSYLGPMMSFLFFKVGPKMSVSYPRRATDSGSTGHECTGS